MCSTRKPTRNFIMTDLNKTYSSFRNKFITCKWQKNRQVTTLIDTVHWNKYHPWFIENLFSTTWSVRALRIWFRITNPWSCWLFSLLKWLINIFLQTDNSFVFTKCWSSAVCWDRQNCISKNTWLTFWVSGGSACRNSWWSGGKLWSLHKKKE